MLHPNNSVVDMSSTGNLNENTDAPPKQQTKKKISKQNSTKTDFFAARLASAVDDIESSDSDETFIYENNDTELDDNASNINNNNNNSTNNIINLDNASVNGSMIASSNAMVTGPPGTSIALGSGLRSPSILEGEQLQYFHDPVRQQQFKLPSTKAPSISNSINSSNNIDSILKRPVHLREASTYSVNDNDHRNLVLPNSTERFTASPSNNIGNENIPQYQKTSSVAHSINEGYNDDTFSYNEVEDNLIDEDSTDDGDLTKNTITNNNNPPTTSSQQQPQPQPQPQPQQPQLHTLSPLNQIQAATSATPSVSTKNASKRNYKTSSTSSKLRSTTSKLFDKKGSQPRRYSTIPDDIDIEDFDDELIYYDNTARFPANESTSLLNQNQRIPHYRSLNLNFPQVKRQSKRYLSTGQPLESSDRGSNKDGTDNGNNSDHNINSPLTANNNNNNVNHNDHGDNKKSNTNNNIANNRAFPFPYQDQQHHYYYDYDDFDQESQINGPNFDLPDLPINRSASQNFNNSNNPKRFGDSHFFLPRKTDQYSQRTSFLKSCIYTFVCILIVLTIGFVLGFVLATTKDLTDVGITSIENPIVSKDELVFNAVIEAFNPGWFSVDINEVELDLFARSGYLPDTDNLKISNMGGSQKVETVKLGTILNFESVLNFKGGFLSREPTIQKGGIRLLYPGKNVTAEAKLVVNMADIKIAASNSIAKESTTSNDTNDNDNSKKWEIISSNPFDLIITGVLKYDLPFSRTSRSVVVRKTGYIDPTLFVIPQGENNISI